VRSKKRDIRYSTQVPGRIPASIHTHLMKPRERKEKNATARTSTRWYLYRN
jgi:hypothetical protein